MRLAPLYFVVLLMFDFNVMEDMMDYLSTNETNREFTDLEDVMKKSFRAPKGNTANGLKNLLTNQSVDFSTMQRGV